MEAFDDCDVPEVESIPEEILIVKPSLVPMWVVSIVLMIVALWVFFPLIKDPRHRDVDESEDPEPSVPEDDITEPEEEEKPQADVSAPVDLGSG